MVELQYIPLKSKSGELCGYALVKDGYIELRPKMRLAGNALILTDAGAITGALSLRIPLPGRLIAAAIVHQSKIECCGAPRGNAPPMEALRRHISLAESSVSPHNDNNHAILGHKPSILSETSPDSDISSPPKSFTEAPRRTATLRRLRHSASAAPQTPAENGPLAPPPALDAETPPPRTKGAKAPQSPAAAPARSVDKRIKGRAWEDDASLAAITRRAEEAFLRMEQRSRAAKAAIEDVPLPSARDKAPANAPGADIESILQAISRVPEDAEPLARVRGTVLPADADDGFSAPPPDPRTAPQSAPAQEASEPSEPASSSTSGDAVWRALFQTEKRDAPPVFHAPPLPDRVAVPNPFPHIFPNASFIRVQDDPLPHLLGTWQRGDGMFSITAVPGSYAPSPPAHLASFTRFIRARSGGYWVLVQEKMENDA